MIRNYNTADLEDVMSIWYETQAKAHPFLDDKFVDMVKTMMTEKFIPNSKTWIYELEGRVIGFIAMMDNEIGGLFVKPNEQSKGVGSQLLNFITQSYNEIEVEVFNENKIGKPFYLKQGFKTTSEYLHEETQQKVLRMQLQIR